MPLRARPCWILLILLATPLTAYAEKVTVTEEHGLYTMSGEFLANVSPPVAWDVLTNYRDINLFVKKMVTDSVERRLDGRVLLHQTLATKNDGPVRLVLEAQEDTSAHTVSIRDTASEDFQGFVGYLQVFSVDSQSLVRYTFVARPKFRWYIPTTLVRKQLVANRIGGIIKGLREEMQRRAIPDEQLVPDDNSNESH